MNRIWKEVTITPYYEVSNDGKVRNKTTKKELTSCPDKDGYLRVILTIGLEKRKTPTIHKLVASAFLPNNNNFPCINHKDENKTNNNVENLEWCSVKYNNSYGTHNEKVKLSNQINNGKRVKAIRDNKEQIFISVKEAGRQLGVNYSNIFSCLKGRISQTGGYKFEEVVYSEYSR